MPQDAHKFRNIVPLERRQDGFTFSNVLDLIALYSHPVQANITSQGADINEHTGKAGPMME